jgi:hypothetical protein
MSKTGKEMNEIEGDLKPEAVNISKMLDILARE